MNELRIFDIIEREFRAMGLPIPAGLKRDTSREHTAWIRVARSIVSEAQIDQRKAARTASIAGSMITRGRTRF